MPTHVEFECEPEEEERMVRMTRADDVLKRRAALAALVFTMAQKLLYGQDYY